MITYGDTNTQHISKRGRDLGNITSQPTNGVCIDIHRARQMGKSQKSVAASTGGDKIQSARTGTGARQGAILPATGSHTHNDMGCHGPFKCTTSQLVSAGLRRNKILSKTCHECYSYGYVFWQRLPWRWKHGFAVQIFFLLRLHVFLDFVFCPFLGYNIYFVRPVAPKVLFPHWATPLCPKIRTYSKAVKIVTDTGFYVGGYLTTHEHCHQHGFLC